MSSLRILLADDFEPWRRFVSSILQKDSRLVLVLEVSDGLEAVRKAQELHPSLILLDIGLPTLNGIEAARKILNVAPNSKILFLSENNSPEIAEEALRVGGRGYVVKSDAGRELLAAVQAVSAGRRYVSAKLRGQGFAEIGDDVRTDAVPSYRHELQFYSDDSDFLNGFTAFIAAGLAAGNAVIVVATESHCEDLIQRLQSRRFDIDGAAKEGSYIPLDVTETLSAFMINDLPDPDRFRKTVNRLIKSASKARNGKLRRVSACGECGPLLWEQGKPDAALQLERLWDEAADQYGLDILCGYVLKGLQSKKDEMLERICSEHSAVIPCSSRSGAA